MATRQPKPLEPKYQRRKTPSAAARRTHEDILDESPRDMPTTEADHAELVKTTLANLVNERIRESQSAREASGIEDEWREAEDLYNGYDNLNQPTTGMRIRDKTGTVASKNAGAGGQSTLIVNIVKPKTKIGTSRVKEMLVPTNDKPFDVGPTPVPELDEVTKDPAMAGQMVPLQDGTPAPALIVAEMMKAKAAEASRKESEWIDDKFIEGKVYGELRRVIDDAARIGTGCIKGPFALCRTTRRWKIDPATKEMALEIKDTYPPTSKRIRMQDCYPDPACGDNIHAGEYFNERDFMTARDLRKLAKDPSYDRVAIAQAVLEGPLSYAMMSAGAANDRIKPGDTRREASLYEVWYSYGDCTPEALIAMGVKDSVLGNDGPDDEGTEATEEEAFDPAGEALTTDQEAALASIPAMVTMLNGRPIKAVIQPLESGEFPYDFFPWEIVDGQPYGKGIPMQMRPAQLIVKSGTRRLLENAGMSSGPQIVTTRGAVVPVDGRYEITGRKLWEFIPTELMSDVRQAMAMFEIPSMQEQLLKLIQFGLKMADEMTNIPIMLHGDENPDAAPETLGGRKLFQSNALSPLRDIAKQYDDYLIIPHLGRYHEWWMANEPGDNKGDSEIKALGSTALIQREEGRQFLLQLFPVKDDPGLRIDPNKFSKEVARAHGYDMTLIQYTDDEWKKVQEAKAQQPPPMAPQVEAAKIRAEIQMQTDKSRAADAEAERGFKAKEGEMQRALDAQLAEIQKEIEMLRLSGSENISLEQIKATLAAKAGELNIKRSEMALKLSPANITHEGI